MKVGSIELDCNGRRRREREIEEEGGRNTNGVRRGYRYK